jgi:hypothetical protein
LLPARCRQRFNFYYLKQAQNSLTGSTITGGPSVLMQTPPLKYQQRPQRGVTRILLPSVFFSSLGVFSIFNLKNLLNVLYSGFQVMDGVIVGMLMNLHPGAINRVIRAKAMKGATYPVNFAVVRLIKESQKRATLANRDNDFKLFRA